MTARWALFVLLILFVANVTQAQTEEPRTSGDILPPKSEKFSDADGIMMPWGDSSRTCDALSANPIKSCPIITQKEYERKRVLSLYDGDGNVWSSLNVAPSSPDYFRKNPTLDAAVQPIGPPPFGPLLLRLVRESLSWYEAEINEKTRETRFIRKDDPLWSRVSWSGVFNMSFNVAVDQSKVKLLDAPNGKVIEPYVNIHYDRLKFMKLEDDWMYVEGVNWGTLYYGWIRWRDGRDILVGSILNGMKIPEAKP